MLHPESDEAEYPRIFDVSQDPEFIESRWGNPLYAVAMLFAEIVTDRRGSPDSAEGRPGGPDLISSPSGEPKERVPHVPSAVAVKPTLVQGVEKVSGYLSWWREDRGATTYQRTPDSGGPDWGSVAFRSTFDVASKRYLEDRVEISTRMDPDLPLPEGSTHTVTTFYYDGPINGPAPTLPSEPAQVEKTESQWLHTPRGLGGEVGRFVEPPTVMRVQEEVTLAPGTSAYIDALPEGAPERQGVGVLYVEAIGPVGPVFTPTLRERTAAPTSTPVKMPLN